MRTEGSVAGVGRAGRECWKQGSLRQILESLVMGTWTEDWVQQAGCMAPYTGGRKRLNTVNSRKRHRRGGGHALETQSFAVKGNRRLVEAVWCQKIFLR